MCLSVTIATLVDLWILPVKLGKRCHDVPSNKNKSPANNYWKTENNCQKPWQRFIKFIGAVIDLCTDKETIFFHLQPALNRHTIYNKVKTI